ncbi:MAG: baseplate J/gp47 family protein [Anaerolineales bacterium]|nr:baseplate J/gp47 family protein [Anaerolineales bacterium]
MKIQIIYLDPQDDQFSAREKMSWAKSPRVLMVWPRRGIVLNRRLDLVLLQREAQQHGTELGLVTFDPDVLNFAAELSIPVFESIDDLPEERWNRPGARSKSAYAPREAVAQPSKKPVPPPIKLAQPPQGLASMRWILFGVTLIALSVLSFTLIPSASVTLYPSTESNTEFVTLILSIDETDTAFGHVSGRTATIQLESDEVVPVSGQVEFPTGAAGGEVVFTNLTDDRITIPAGTGVRPDSGSTIRYETTRSITLPAGIGSQASVSILASSPGPEGNLPANSLTAIEGDLAFSAQVTNPLLISGGTIDMRAGVSAADQQFARDVAVESITLEAVQVLENTLLTDEYLLRDRISQARVIDIEFDHKIGTATDFLGIHLEAEIEAIIINRSSLENAIWVVLESGLDPAEEIHAITHIELLDTRGEAETIMVNVEFDTIPVIDPASIRSDLRLMPIADVKPYLSDHYPMQTAPDIAVHPGWLPLMPLLDARLSINQTVATP